MGVCIIMGKTSKLLGVGKSITVAGETLPVKPISAKMLFRVNKDLAAGLQELMASVKGGIVKSGKSGFEGAFSTEFVLSIVNLGPRVLGVFDMAVGKTKGFCENLSIADLSEVIVAVFEVNDVEKIARNFQVARVMTMKTGSEKPAS